MYAMLDGRLNCTFSQTDVYPFVKSNIAHDNPLAVWSVFPSITLAADQFVFGKGAPLIFAIAIKRCSGE